MNWILQRLRRGMIHLLFTLAVVSCASQPEQQAIDYNRLDTTVIQVASKTDLMLAAESGSAQAMKQAFQSGAKINAVAPEGTAFSLSLQSGKLSMSKFLLSAGADPSLGFSEGEPSALMLVAESANNDLMQDILARKVDINYVDNKGYSALAAAAIKGHLTTMKMLLAAGADANGTPDGQSLLMKVVDANNMLLSQMLIEAGADVNYRTEDGDTALRIARRKGYYDLDLMLVQAGARP